MECPIDGYPMKNNPPDYTNPYSLYTSARGISAEEYAKLHGDMLRNADSELAWILYHADGLKNVYAPPKPKGTVPTWVDLDNEKALPPL